MRKVLAVTVSLVLLLSLAGIALAVVSGTSKVPPCPCGHDNDGFGCGRWDGRYCYYQCKHLGCTYCWDGYYPVEHCTMDGICIYCGMQVQDTAN
ncbi:MAG: hypothetical protein CW338_06975 [Clostridiales bacterium]|nr:hypothetical protein [Clostridiales bacterium]